MRVSSAAILATSFMWCTGAVQLAARDMDMHMGTGTDVPVDNPPAATAVTSAVAASVSPVPHEGGHEHGMPILHTNLTPAERLYWENYNTTTFFTTSRGNRGALWTHCVSLVAATTVFYPVSLMFHSIQSRWYLPALILFNCSVVIARFSLAAFGASIRRAKKTHPDTPTYPGSVYGRFCDVLLLAALAHLLAAAVLRWKRRSAAADLDSYRAFYDDEDLNNSAGIPLNDMSAEASDAATSPSSAPSKRGGSPPPLFRDLHEFPGLAARAQSAPTVRSALRGALHGLPAAVFGMLNYPLLVVSAATCVVGLAVGNLLGDHLRVFNLLAHWIKGGVFIILGTVSLARYCGFGAHRGWAWNRVLVLKREQQQRGLTAWQRLCDGVTMEGIESGLIFFYGSTNVFLEHLSNQDGKWHAKDLQHVSIAFMFIGCGLCGLITEFKLRDWRVRHVLKAGNAPEDDVVARDSDFVRARASDVATASPGYSPNPFPAVTIFWTGILMSQHAQASQTSTTIHMQWGYLLSYGSFFRLFTFLLLMFVPNCNSLPSRPFTELVTSFCLLCGGLIFMESTDQVVEALEYRGFTSMFTFNLSVGVTALFMAWEMLLFLWRDLLRGRKENKIA
ncbi:LAMI_0D08130g1_1 [Lachancea mirantina]|uniref:LAMI_0D08130g1_1 n=1 Tax=Lachancea mirantina TaxID=1230905 RepID=A0A1G4JCR2_9SACH|nr:LAMI_0D08130g1_1 [Lachancea mirantina]